jgi:hypothetical protein
MVRDVLVAVAAVAAVFGGAFGLLAVVFRAQVRRYDRTVAVERLDDWAAQQELLEKSARERAVPPAEILDAMAALPAPGWRSSWDKPPVKAS